jgi:Holliday junction resolvase RusA-like endonuclease
MTVLTERLSPEEARREVEMIQGRRLGAVSEAVGFTIIQFSLPAFPVPLSSCFKNVGRNGRADTDRYASWKRETDHKLSRKRIPHVEGNVSVTYTVRRPDKRKRDLDNLLKALNDTLARNFVIEDDSNITDLRIRWATTEVFEGEVFVEITKVAA